jgi:hypothetical protein
MRGKYKAAFLVPAGAEKSLGDDGWEFKSEAGVSEDVKYFLTDILDLNYSKTKLGISYYESESVQASLFYDEQGTIENVYFQVYGRDMEPIEKKFLESSFVGSLEFFIPSN